MIINSIVNIHNLLVVIDSSLSSAGQRFADESSDIAKAFGSFTSNKAMKIVLDVFGLFFSLGMSVAFTKGS